MAIASLIFGIISIAFCWMPVIGLIVAGVCVVVTALILNSKNEILISKRAEHKKYPLMWECNGGSIVAGETSLEGILREIKEELGKEIEITGEGKLLIDSKKSGIKGTKILINNTNLNIKAKETAFTTVNTDMIVNRGLGNPMVIPRLFNRPEITVITLN